MKCLISRLLLLVLMAPLLASATDYYVRPYRASPPNGLGNYGMNNGLAHGDAWNGLGSVKWYEVDGFGIRPGDTLFVCGMHPNEQSPIHTSANWQVLAQVVNGVTIWHRSLVVRGSGLPGAPITINFDCPNDPGLILLATRQMRYVAPAAGQLPVGWDAVPGMTGIYSVDSYGGTDPYIEYDTSPSLPAGTSRFRRLKNAGEVPSTTSSVWTSQNGVAFHDGSKYYYKPSAGVESSYTYVNGTGYTYFENAVVVIEKSDVVIKGRLNITPVRDFMNGGSFDPSLTAQDEFLTTVAGTVVLGAVKRVKVDGVFTKYAPYGGPRPVSPCSDLEIAHSRVEESMNGIYNITVGWTLQPDGSYLPQSSGAYGWTQLPQPLPGFTTVTCDNTWIHDNYIANIDRVEYWPPLGVNTDRHGIQFEGGNYNRVEYNYVDRVGTHGIGFDSVMCWNNPATPQIECPGEPEGAYGPGLPTSHNVVRYNFINDINRNNRSGETVTINKTALQIEGHNSAYDPDAPDSPKSNNLVYNNIFARGADFGVSIGLAGKTADGSGISWKFFNNTVFDNRIGVAFADSFDQTPPYWNPGHWFKNGLIADAHSRLGAGSEQLLVQAINKDAVADRSGVQWDFNTYHRLIGDPDLGFLKYQWRKSTWANGGCRFSDIAGWRNAPINLSCNPSGDIPPSIFEQNSQELDGNTSPFQTSPGTSLKPSDFRLGEFSGAVDAGSSDSLSEIAQLDPDYAQKDILGNPIYGRPDAGAVEYQPPYVMEDDVIPGFPLNGHKIAENVRVYGDGRYRNLPPTASPVDHQAELDVFPQSAYGTTDYSPSDYRHWMDIRVSEWTNQKIWTVTRALGTGNGNFRYFVRGVQSGQTYYVCHNDSYFITVQAFGAGEATFARGHTEGETVKFELFPTSTGSSATCKIANLSVVVTDTPDPALTDSPMSYGITVSNAGPSAATNLVVTHTLPNGVTGSGVPSQGNCTGTSVISCNLGTVNNSQSATITVTATPNAEALFDPTPNTTFSVNINATTTVSAAEADPVSANNSAMTTTNVRLACLGQVVTKRGTSGNDGSNSKRFAGGSGADVIHTLSGNDWIDGKGGNDTICGGAGNDNINGSGGNDALSGGSEMDTCNGGNGTDTTDGTCESWTQ